MLHFWSVSPQKQSVLMQVLQLEIDSHLVGVGPGGVGPGGWSHVL